MSTSTRTQLAQSIRSKIADLKTVCEGIDEDAASRAPVGRWSPKEILSHLWGPGESSHLQLFQAFLDKDTPTLDVEAENPFLTEERARMTFHRLAAEVEKEYRRVSDFVEGLSATQAARKAHIPLLKDSPLGEYPTLEALAAGLGEYHLQFHIDHLREILGELGTADA